MHNITLVCTRHKELGNCNSAELYKIIEKINPEIIFEELSHDHYDQSYNTKTLVGLETNAILAYQQNHSIEHIPVDTYKLPNSFWNDIDGMYNVFFNSMPMVECRELRYLMDDEARLISSYGFDYLNSNRNDEMFEKIDILKTKILDIKNNENLFRISKMEKEVIEKRELEIIDNIYNYSSEYEYKQGLMFIGSGHRKSIIEKIGRSGLQKEIKLNWIFHQG